MWFCIDRGTIEDFGDYEEMHDMGDVENYEDFVQQWKDNYLDEKKWYCVQAVQDEESGYKAVAVNHKFVIVIDPRAEKGYEHDIDSFANWLCEETEKCIEQLKNNTYMNFVRKNLPSIHRTGTILQKHLWNMYPEEKEDFFEGITDKDVDDFIVVTLEDGNKRRCILSHYFMPFYNGHRYQTILLHGHSHSSEESNIEQEIAKNLNERGFQNEIYNVGCMHWNYEPVTLDEILAARKEV